MSALPGKVGYLNTGGIGVTTSSDIWLNESNSEFLSEFLCRQQSGSVGQIISAVAHGGTVLTLLHEYVMARG